MIRAYIATAALVAALALAGALWYVTGQRDTAQAEAARLSADLAVTRATIAQQAEAAAVHRIHLRQAQQAAAQAQADEAAAMTGEGANAPLDDYLRAILDRVR